MAKTAAKSSTPKKATPKKPAATPKKGARKAKEKKADGPWLHGHRWVKLGPNMYIHTLATWRKP